MAYLKPSTFQRRVFNPIAMRFRLAGTATLVVRGRRSGNELSVPIIPVEHEGARYIVSTRGEAEWVRNLRAAGEATLRTGDGSETFAPTEIVAAERTAILDAYRAKAGRTVSGYFKQLPSPDDHPIFRIDPIGG